jgi:hypothetical protein
MKMKRRSEVYRQANRSELCIKSDFCIKAVQLHARTNVHVPRILVSFPSLRAPALIFFCSLPDKFLTVSLVSFNLPTLTRPFLAPTFLDLVTIAVPLSCGSGGHYTPVLP